MKEVEDFCVYGFRNEFVVNRSSEMRNEEQRVDQGKKRSCG